MACRADPVLPNVKEAYRPLTERYGGETLALSRTGKKKKREKKGKQSKDSQEHLGVL